jgi:4a-hydroxytetrahydrobiopterin dehydratase
MKYLKNFNENIFESLEQDVNMDIITEFKWIENDNKLKRKIEFENFKESLDFINRLATICESMNHHPEINWIYNKIELTLSTHDAGDKITELDYQLANKIDELIINKI